MYVLERVVVLTTRPSAPLQLSGTVVAPRLTFSREQTMTNRPKPILTICLLLILVGLYGLVPDKSLLYFSSDEIASGEIWRLISGHFMHADLQHLLWNCLGLAVIGALIEQHSRADWWLALMVGVMSVSALLLSPFSQLDHYCGLSGVLNTLLLVLLWLEWRLTRSWLVVVIALGSIAKAIIEVSVGESLLTQISWPPYAWSHVAGLVGGLMIILLKKAAFNSLHLNVQKLQ
jgi:rhomboid family GlyGly-CTERM serine protease